MELQVFQTEYNQVCDVARCPIPYMSFCTGAWMGFGVGNSAHGDVRIVTEKTLFAMPENAIGLFPDVGFAHVATQMPGKAWTHPDLWCCYWFHLNVSDQQL